VLVHRKANDPVAKLGGAAVVAVLAPATSALSAVSAFG
jgi:hypothetical protein